MRPLLVLVAVFMTLLFVAPSPSRADGDAKPCVLCAGAKSVPCPTCAGKGRGPATCRACRGAGKPVCLARPDGVDSPLRRLLSIGWKHVEPDALKCPNMSCDEGQIGSKGKPYVDGKFHVCVVCSGKGLIPCVDCKAAQAPCAECSGKGKLDAPCLDCGGMGKLPCLLCAPSDGKCPQCDGAASIKCPRCAGRGTGDAPCPTCGARGKAMCHACLGSGKETCLECLGIGFKDNDGEITKQPCSKCKGTTVTTCTLCTAGRSTCVACKGRKRLSGPCVACVGRKSIPCRTCGDFGYRVPELLADVLAKQAKDDAAKQAAIKLYERARKSAVEGVARVAARETKHDLSGLPSSAVTDARSELAIRYAREEISRRLAAELDRAAEDAEFAAAVVRIDKALAALHPQAPK